MALVAKHNDTDFHIGDTVRVHQKIQEGDLPAVRLSSSAPSSLSDGSTELTVEVLGVEDLSSLPKGSPSKSGKAGKSRTQIFQGTVIAIRGEGINKMFTVRRLGAVGIGIERIFPLASPLIEKIDVVAKGHVKRAKLYYLRQKPPSEVAALTRRKQSKSKTKTKTKTKVKKIKRQTKSK